MEKVKIETIWSCFEGWFTNFEVKWSRTLGIEYNSFERVPGSRQSERVLNIVNENGMKRKPNWMH
jgi:hypothetical protein